MAFQRKYSGPEPIRLNKWLGQSGVCSRRDAEALIGRGAVQVDGEVIADPGRKLLPGQTVTISDDPASARGGAVSVLVHKPVGVVSAHPEPHQWEAADLLTPERFARGPGTQGDNAAAGLAAGLSLPPLGRLDRDSRGLLLLSSDGVLAKAVIGPASRVDKAYEVEVDGEPSPQRLARLRHGLSLDGHALRPAIVERIGPQRLSFTLTEGRNRQIRRMCRLVGLEVVDLLRVRIGPLELGDLPEACWRPLSPDEREALVATCRPGDPAV